jgi:hydrogenase-4 component F
MAHSLTKASLFLSAGILHRQYRSRLTTDTVDDIRDVFRYQLLAAWGIIIGGLAIIGTPFSPLFFSEVFILIQLGGVSLPALFLLLLLLFTAAAALGYFVITSFSRLTAPEIPADIEPYLTPLNMNLPILFLLVLIVCLGMIFTRGEISFFDQIVQELMF